MKISISLRDEKNLTRLYCLTLYFYIILVGVNSFFNGVIGNTVIDSIVVYFAFALCIIFAVPQIVKRISDIHILLVFGFVILMLLGSIMNNGATLKVIGKTIFTNGMAFFIGISFSDFNNMEKIIRRFTIFAFFCGLSHIVFSSFQMSGVLEDMPAAYSFLPVAVMMFYYALEELNIINVVFAITSFVILFIFGTRGPILVSLIAFAILWINYSNKTKVKLIGILVIGFLILFFSTSMFDSFIKWSSDYFSKFGISNLFLIRLKTGNLFDPNGRDYLAAEAKRLIASHPLIGLGAFADRVMIGQYVHNIFLELLLDYGIIFGTAFFLFYIGSVIVLFIQYKRNKFAFAFLLTLASLAVGQLFLSSSYLESSSFFIMTGLIFNNKINYKFKLGV